MAPRIGRSIFALLTVIVTVRAQAGCPLSSLMDTAALTTSLESTRAVSGIGERAEPPANLMVHDQRVVCLVTTPTRNQYQYASVVVVFSCTGDTSSGSMLGDDCRPDNYTSQFDFQCRSGLWEESLSPLTVGNGSDLNFFINATANFTTELDTFCSLCVDPGRNIPADDPIPIDPITHCAACDGSCLTSPDGQELCYGTTSGQCCNVFENNICELECSNGTAPKLQEDEKTLVCEPVCDDLTNPTSGLVEYDPTGPHFLGTVATYSCDVGYTLGSPANATCEVGADWSNTTTPVCTLIDCGEEALTEGGTGVFEDGEVDIPSPTTLGAVARYRCDGNYVLEGNEERVCQDDSRWNGTIPACVCGLEPAMILLKNCTPCDELFGVDCKECDEDKCTVCKNGRELVDGKCIFGEESGGSSGGGGCEIGCIIGIVIAAIILAVLLAALIAAIIYGIYKYKISPATKLKKLEGEGLNGVARDNPLYVDPSTVEEEVAAGGGGGEATGL